MSAPLERVAELLRRETGIVTAASQLPAIAAALARIADGMDSERFMRERSGPDGARLLARLVDEATVKETYFFRELLELRTVDWQRLWRAAVARGQGSVRVWVAACATGEEAYSLAILASEAFGTLQPPVSILATDVSDAAVQRASEATYAARALRNVPEELRERYFTGSPGRQVVAAPTRSLVRCRRHNLLGDPVPPAGEPVFDVIACRNVLIYFDAATAGGVIGSFESALRPDGQLVLGVADRLSGSAAILGRAPRPPARVERRRSRNAPRPARLTPEAGVPGRPARAVATPVARTPAGATPVVRPPAGATPAARMPAVPAARPGPRRRAEDRVEDALGAADAGDLERAAAIVDDLLAADPLNADGWFVRGLVELGAGDAERAAASFRGALYADPAFGVAAFHLGRAHDARGDPGAATRAYQQALRTIDPEDGRHPAILAKVDLGDVAAACRSRLARLRDAPVTGRA